MPTKDRHQPPAVRRASRELASDVQRWRKLRGLTQDQVADRAGVSRGLITRLEAGEDVRLEAFIRVLRALGILEVMVAALDPYQSDVGRLRSEEHLPQRVRPKKVP